MDTNQEPHESNFPPTDPALDALLDKAVSHGSPKMDPGLADRIVAHTLPMLPREGGTPANEGGVLARIGPFSVPAMMRIAAVVAVVAGAWIAVSVMNQDIGISPGEAPTLAVNPSDALFAEIVPGLKEIDLAVEQGNTRIDEQLDVLGLRIDLASSEDVWGAADQDTNERIGDAITGFEFDQFSADAMLLMDDGSAYF